MRKPRFRGLLADIAEVAGEEAALAIGLKCGGKRVYFSGAGRPIRDTNWILQTVGPEKAALIQSLFPRGETVVVPVGIPKNVFLVEKIKRFRERGYSISRIAKKTKLTERTVYYHLAKLRRAGAIK